jgi:hypothetical protein
MAACTKHLHLLLFLQLAYYAVLTALAVLTVPGSCIPVAPGSRQLTDTAAHAQPGRTINYRFAFKLSNLQP